MILLLLSATLSAFAGIDQCRVHAWERETKTVAVIFDGFENFTSGVRDELQELMKRKPQCLSVLEGDRFVQKVVFEDDTSMSFAQMKSRLMARGRAGGLVSFLHHFCEEQSLDLKDLKLLYFDWTESKALRCLQRIKREAPGTATLVFGYSFGGHRATTFAREADRAGLALDLGVSMDPIPPVVKALPANYFRRLFDVDVPLPELVVPKGTRWVNFYQTSERKAYLGSGLHGFAVKNAENVFVPLKVTPHGHWDIFYATPVRERLRSALFRFQDP